MSCYYKIKKNLEVYSGVKVKKEGEYIKIFKNGKQLLQYNIKFVEYDRQNMNVFIEYWEFKLQHN